MPPFISLLLTQQLKKIKVVRVNLNQAVITKMKHKVLKIKLTSVTALITAVGTWHLAVGT
jgi:hypothetical protein